MGTTLQNGVYLPNEGERNCYAGLKTNWEILDQKVADVTALQQAVAGALHREIVASLPTTDIDPNTIYMILSGTSATENVYNEFMYVNNAWELIGTSATDLTNYYTKGDVDGLLLLKANASDLTSHTGDTTIHVTSADKTKWNTVALIKQLRLVNAQVGSATTIAFANIDDTNGIKVGDKCMDLDAKMFEITAVDTSNQTVTVGTALIDLALDANVVHTSGNETVGGQKTFSSDTTIYNSTASVQADTPNLLFKNPLVERASTTLEGEQTILFTDKNDNNIGSIQAKTYTSGMSDIILTSYSETSDQSVRTTGIVIRRTPTTSKFHGYSDNITTLGDTNRRWKSVYAINYYYGSDNTEFSTKFVTTDTAQAISGAKTFTDNIVAKKIVSNVSQLQINAKTNADSIAMIGGDSASEGGGVWVYGKNTSNKSMVTLQVYDTDNSAYHAVRLNMDGSLTPTVSNNGLGSSSYKWVSFNGLEPSSLSLPDLDNGLDISGYITDLTGASNINKYTPLVNGWISVGLSKAEFIELYIPSVLMGGTFTKSSTNNYAQAFMPVIANKEVRISLKGTSIGWAKFYPCQGNV